ncbi:MAG TPA: PilZ domain-containing protein [Vicinamibacterales bacterium]|nr:PilZ domain-containing protein [Vicinamibacterales bacterium]
MSFGSHERRRSHRVPVAARSEFLVPTAWPVQVQDIGLGGLAFISPFRLELGRRVHVFGTLAQHPFKALVQICWSTPRRGRTAAPREDFDIGAVFVEFTGDGGQILKRFLTESPSA